MKHTLVFIILVIASCMSSCSLGERLALQLEGTWMCSKLKLGFYSEFKISELMCEGKFTFIKDDGENGGPVTVEANIKAHGYGKIYNARVVANGSWTAYDMDEILLIFESDDIHISPANPSVPLPLNVRDAIRQGFKDLGSINYIDIKNGFLKGRISYEEVVMKKK